MCARERERLSACLCDNMRAIRCIQSCFPLIHSFVFDRGVLLRIGRAPSHYILFKCGESSLEQTNATVPCPFPFERNST